MRLEEIGFYTLSDLRADTSTVDTPLYRCELLLTKRCNFHCPYCRGLNGDDISKKEALRVLRFWISNGLKNVRFSGGEPTLYPGLIELVNLAKSGGVEHIAVSTNGSASPPLYDKLIASGVNDFSVSLDACCSSTGDMLSGTRGLWTDVVRNIMYLAGKTYVTVGIVLTDSNSAEAVKIIKLAHKLGVADIRVIPAAQYSKTLSVKIPKYVYSEHPILKYRLTNSRPVRGLAIGDCRSCGLVLDDMVVWNGEHYPCIIYLREGGQPIGKINRQSRIDRLAWYNDHDSWEDSICRNNCLDVCRDFNNRKGCIA